MKCVFYNMYPSFIQWTIFDKYDTAQFDLHVKDE